MGKRIRLDFELHDHEWRALKDAIIRARRDSEQRGGLLGNTQANALVALQHSLRDADVEEADVV